MGYDGVWRDVFVMVMVDWDVLGVECVVDGGCVYGGVFMGVEMLENVVFVVVGMCAIVFIGASCYFEEYVYKLLLNFDYYWMVVLVELMVFVLILFVSLIVDGMLFVKWKVFLELYAL